MTWLLRPAAPAGRGVGATGFDGADRLVQMDDPRTLDDGVSTAGPAVFTSASATWRAVMPEENSTAAAPATWGEAIDVPWISL